MFRILIVLTLTCALGGLKQQASWPACARSLFGPFFFLAPSGACEIAAGDGGLCPPEPAPLGDVFAPDPPGRSQGLFSLPKALTGGRWVPTASPGARTVCGAAAGSGGAIWPPLTELSPRTVHGNVAGSTVLSSYDALPEKQDAPLMGFPAV